MSPAPTTAEGERSQTEGPFIQFVATCLGGLNRSLRRNSALMRRSLIASLVVGTALVMINQGPALLTGDLHYGLTWRVPLNYLVPYLVATWGALSNRDEQPQLEEAQPATSLVHVLCFGGQTPSGLPISQ